MTFTNDAAHGGAWVLAALIALEGCHPSPRPLPPPPRVAGAPKHHASPERCPRTALRTATVHLEQGRPWSARRSLERCTELDDAQLLLAETEAALGDWRAAQGRVARLGAVNVERVKKLRASIAAQRARTSKDSGDRATEIGIDQKLKEAKHLLQLDDPEQGGAWAQEVYFAVAPQPEAALLAARAASLQGDTPQANLWFARAAFDLRERYGELSWLPLRVNDYERSARFDTGGTLTISLERDPRMVRELRASEVGEDWAYHLRSVERPQTHRAGQWWEFGGYDLEHVDEELVASRLGTGDVAWRLRVDERARQMELVPALGSRGLLELATLNDTCVLRWRRIDLDTGEATPYRFVPKVCQPMLQFAEPGADWFAFETPSADWQDTVRFVVDRSGRTKSWPTNRWPEGTLLTRWSEQELLVGGATDLWAVNVWTLQRSLVASVPTGVGRVTEAARDDDGVVFLSGSRGNGFVEQRAGSEGSAQVVPLEPTALQQLRIDDWSPGAERVVGRSRTEPWRVQIWHLKQRRCELSLTTLADGARASVDTEGRHLALTFHASALRLDLATSDWEFTRVPGARRQHQPVFVDGGVALAPAMWWWSSDGPILERHELGVNIHGRWLGAGPWLGRAAERTLWLARNPELALSVDVEVTRYVALSPHGRYAAVAFLDDQRRLHAGILALTPTPPRAQVIWSRAAKQVDAVFSRDGRHAQIATEDGWFDISLPDGRARRTDARWPAVPLQLAQSGRRALLPTGVVSGPDGTLVTLEDPPGLPEGESSSLLGFALDDEVVVGASKREITLWQSRSGAVLGRLLPIGRGWAFAPAGVGAAGTEPLELLGDTSDPALLCVADDHVLPWEVCDDYFTRPGLLAQTLARAAH